MYKIDKKDRLILNTLNDNCRKSNSQIGKIVGLSRDSIAYRIKNLENEGIIGGYTLEINYEELGYVAYSCAVKLQNASKEREDKIVDFLFKKKSITFIEKTLSKYDLAFIILVNSLEKMDEEIKSIRKFIGTNLKYIEMGISLEDYEFPNLLFDSKEIKDNAKEKNKRTVK